MNRRQHSRLARLLIEAAGGLEEAAGACRVSKTQLSEYQNPHGEGWMPADVMLDLQKYVGRPVYSDAITKATGAQSLRGDLKEAALDVTEAASRLQATTRQALADGRITPLEMDSIAHAERDLEDMLARVKAIRAEVEGETPKRLRTV